MKSIISFPPDACKLQDLQHNQGEIVSKHTRSLKFGDRGMNRLDEFAGILLQVRTYNPCQSFHGIFFSRRILGLNNSVGEKYKHVSAAQIDLCTLIRRPWKHTQHGTSFV